MADEKHEHGTMDTTVQERVFANFIRVVTNSVIGIAVFLLFLYAVNG